MRTKDYFKYCERYKVELEQPVKEIRNMIRIWPQCKIESVIMIHILQLWGLKMDMLLTSGKIREGFLKEVIFELGLGG